MRRLQSVLVLALIAGALGSAQVAVAREWTTADRSAATASVSTASEPDFWEFWTHPLNVSKSSTDEAEWPSLATTADGGTVYVDLSLPWERVLITHIVAERDATEPVEETAETLDGVLPLLLDDSPVFIQKY